MINYQQCIGGLFHQKRELLHGLIPAEWYIVKGRTTVSSVQNKSPGNQREFEPIHLKEKFSYGLGDVACNVVFALTTSLLFYFYTNVIGIGVGTVGTIMLISRFFDGISDVLIGHLVDRTHSRHGKSRAWILWMMFPYGLSAILLFTVPPASSMVQIIYVFITYNFCTTVVYTSLNLPYATLATLMTRDTDQRSVINLFRTGMSAIGNLIITAITFPLVTLLGNTQQAWIEVSIGYAVVSIVMLYVCFHNCHERVNKETKTRDGKKIPLWMGIKLCLSNPYFILFFFLTVFLSFYEVVTGTCNAYYAQYILGNRDLCGALSSFENIPQVITVLILAPFLIRFGKRNVALIGAAAAVIGTVSLFFNPTSISLSLFACVMRGIGKGCFRGAKYSMLADIIEYGAWKSGIRVQGLVVSATTAGQKFGSGITNAAFGALMSMVGFAGTAVINATQSAMLIRIYIIGNILAWGGICILLLFYRLDKIYPRIIADMQAREAAE